MPLEKTGYSRAITYTIRKTTNGSDEFFTYSMLDAIGGNLEISLSELGMLSIRDYIIRVNNVKAYAIGIHNNEFFSTNYVYTQLDDCCPATIPEILLYSSSILSECELIDDGTGNPKFNTLTGLPYYSGNSRRIGLVITKTINGQISFSNNYMIFDNSFTHSYYNSLDLNYSLTLEKVLTMGVINYSLLHADFISYLSTLSELNGYDIYNDSVVNQPIMFNSVDTCQPTTEYEQICTIEEDGCEVITPTPTITITPTITQTLTPTITQTITPTLTITQTITPTITQTITPTITQTITPTITQTITPTITQTITPTITQTITPTGIISIVVDSCDVIYNADAGSIDKLYAYNFTSNESTYLGDVPLSTDIAVTEDKLWTFSGSQNINEYNIVRNPWSITFNRTITNPYNNNAALVAIDNNTLVIGGYYVRKLNISGSTATLIDEFAMPITSEALYCTELVYSPNRDSYFASYHKNSITQIHYLGEFTTSGVLLNSTTIDPLGDVYSMFTDNGNLYLINGYDVYNVNPDSLSRTYVKTISGSDFGIAGAAQTESCVTIPVAQPYAKVVIGGNGVGSQYSLDEVNWVDTTLTTNTGPIIHVNNKWNAFSNSISRAYYSSINGIDWTYVKVAPIDSSQGTYDVCWTGKNYVICGQGSTVCDIAVSADAITWTNLYKLSGGMAQGLACNGSYVICGGSSVDLYSTNDGETWTPFTLLNVTVMYGACYNGSIWVIVGSGTSHTISTAASQPHLGTTGRGKTIFTTRGARVAWNGTMFVAVGTGTNHVGYSYDGITWVGLGLFTGVVDMYDVKWDGNTWWICGSVNITTQGIFKSTNGIDWTPVGINTQSGQSSYRIGVLSQPNLYPPLN